MKKIYKAYKLEADWEQVMVAINFFKLPRYISVFCEFHFHS
jgi:hypothetical protein